MLAGHEKITLRKGRRITAYPDPVLFGRFRPHGYEY
jgi:hypothetical protein